MQRNGTYYMNNSGHRWVNFTDGKKPKVKILKDKYCPFEDEEITRTAIFFESFGNFAACYYYYKGKRYSTLNYELINN